jgi:hypothetical protein
MIIKCATYDVETTFQLVKDGKKKKYDPSPFNTKNYLVAAGVQCFDINWNTEERQIVGIGPSSVHLAQTKTRSALANIVSILQSCQLMLGHFIKFDLVWTRTSGRDLHGIPTYDTGIAEFVLARGQRVALDLDSVAQRYGFPGKEDKVAAMIKAGVSPSEIPWDLLSKYLAVDLERTTQVAIEQIKRNKLNLQQLAHM